MASARRCAASCEEELLVEGSRAEDVLASAAAGRDCEVVDMLAAWRGLAQRPGNRSAYQARSFTRGLDTGLYV